MEALPKPTIFRSFSCLLIRSRLNDILHDFNDFWCPCGGSVWLIFTTISIIFSERDSGCEFRAAVVLPRRPGGGQARVRVLFRTRLWRVVEMVQYAQPHAFGMARRIHLPSASPPPCHACSCLSVFCDVFACQSVVCFKCRRWPGTNPPAPGLGTLQGSLLSPPGLPLGAFWCPWAPPGLPLDPFWDQDEKRDEK